MYDVIIIGAGCAGMTAAIYVRRAGMSALMLESEAVGGQIVYSPRVENYPASEATDGAAFAEKLFAQTKTFGAELSETEALGLRSSDGLWHIDTPNGELSCRAVIIASGQRHKKLGLECEDEYVGQGLSYCAVCDGIFYENSAVAVIGGGNTALTDAEYLAEYCSKVYLVHRRMVFRGDAALVERLKRKNNVEFVLPYNLKSFIAEKGSVKGLLLTHAETGAKRELFADGVFVAVGQTPRTAIIANLLELDTAGYIITDENCSTAVPGVFAAGDCRAKAVRQLVTAASDGAVAALAAVDYIKSIAY